MTVRERMLAIRLWGQLGHNPDYARRLGISVEINEAKDGWDGGKCEEMKPNPQR